MRIDFSPAGTGHTAPLRAVLRFRRKEQGQFTSGLLHTLVLAILLPSLAWWSGPVAANPRGGSIVHGDVNIGAATGGMLDIRQNSRNAIINWESFSIDAGELTRFRQPTANSAVLNRVTGGDPSAIHGALRANGNVFVINPNGILVGPGGTIDVHGLVLSTLDLDNGEFLAGGDMVMKGVGGGVTNLGRINAIGGDVFLIGQTVRNSGSVSAPEGTAGLAAGEEVLLKAGTGAGDERIFVRAAGAGVSGNGIFNDGTISGAAVELKAHGNMYALAINNKGAIRATGSVNSGGRVYLRGAGGRVSNSGSIRASSTSAGASARILIEAAYAKVDGELRASGSGIGGKVEIKAGELAEIGGTISAASSSGVGGVVDIEGTRIVLESDSLIDVSGSTGGGRVRIGGGFQGGDSDFRHADEIVMEQGAVIIGDATESGSGGTVVLWSEGETDFKGNISAQGIGSARGGLVEVSGREGLIVDGTVSTLAENGEHGILLLDPKNISISTAASSATNINNTTLASLVVANHVVVSTLDPGTVEAGNISVLAQVRYHSANSLTLLAEGDLYIGDNIINQGAGDVNLVAGWNPAVAPLSSLLTGTTTPHATLPGTSTSTGGIDMDTSLFSVPGAFGNGGGSIYVGSLGAPDIAADRAIAVGSRTGQTNVAGYDVNVWGAAYTGGINAGAQRYSQIGYNRRVAGTAVTDPATGRVKVKALNDVAVVANKYEVGIQGSSGWTSTTDNTGNASFAQIGHGGERDSVEDMQLSGEIIVEAGGDLNLLGGLAYNNHASIGHGGYDNLDTDGTNLATLGGEITVTAGGDVNLIAGLGYHAHVQIGHGGGKHVLADFTESDIQVTAGGDVTVRGGAGSPAGSSSHEAQAQIGHGGMGADFIVDGAPALAGSGKGYKGDITVDAGGSVRVEAGMYDAFNIAVIGNGGIEANGDHSGDITVTAGGGIDVTGGNSSTTLFAQIGHIAYNSSNALSGDVRVSSGDGGIRLQGGNSAANYATIGSGGYQILEGSSISGGTYLTSLGTDAIDGITLQSGNGDNSSAHIGHLAERSAGTTTHPSISLSGDVSVQVAGGGLRMEASALGYFSHVMIGHGGRDISGNKAGNIDVRVASGNLSVLAGGLNAASRYNHAQIGHGGYGNGITGTSSGDIEIEAENGEIEILGGRNGYSYAQVGHGGTRAGTASVTSHFGEITANASGDITSSGGDSSYSYAQIGHGGVSSIANNVMHMGGAIAVEAGNHVTVSGGKGTYTYAKIGHGGVLPTSTSLSSISASPISVNATEGDVLLLSGTTSYSGAKIGHGDYNLKLSSFEESSVNVTAGRHIRLVSPQFETFSSTANSGTQIGHGGFGATVGAVPSTLGYSGDVGVSAGGKIDILAGKNSGSYNWSLLGHTSYFNSTGIHSGDITVQAGTVAGLDEYGVTVRGGSGNFLPLAGTNSTAGSYYSFASIGHRGHSNAPATYSTGLSGDILVDVIRGGVSLEGGDGVDGSTTASTPPDIRLNGAQIGHGGYAAGHLIYGINGSVRVHAQDDIVLRSGTSRNAAVMIGHGGYSSFGPMGQPGDVIEVISNDGSLELDSTLAINTTRGGVMIGHGAPTPGSGTRMGDILIDVAGEISFVGNLSSIGHRTTTTGGITDADVTIRGRSFDRLTGDSGSEIFRVDPTLGTMLAANMAGGHLSLVGMGSEGIEMNARMALNTPFDLNVLSYADIFIVDDLINRGSGDINVFAGWDPSIAPLFAGATDPYRGDWIRDVNADTDLFGVTGSYGNGEGSVWVGAKSDLSAADRSVVVGSRVGQTNVAGHDVRVWGAAFTGGIEIGHQRYSQIGYTRVDGGSAIADPVTGRIRVGAVNDVEVAANHYAVGVIGYGGWGTGTNNSGNASYAQIGHGGERTSVRDQALSGEIIVEAGGDVDLLGGITFNNHATIGHGAYDNPDIDGNNLATLGGDITVTAGGNVNLAAGLGYHAQAQIGHGGASHYLADFFESDINVTAGGDVTVRGGGGAAATTASQASAQIGHGGYNGDFIADSNPGVPVSAGSGRGYKGDITVDAGGNVRIEGGMLDANNFAAIGNGGILADGDHSGDITVTAGGGIDVQGGTANSGLFAQIGHIAYDSANAISGDVRVQSGDGGIRLSGGNSTANHATIGSGGYAIKEGSTISGGTYVTSLGTDPTDGITMRAGDGSNAGAHIGHIAERTAGGTVHPEVGLFGDVVVDVAGGGLAMDASVLGYFSHAQIGHGGRDITGDKSGNITITVASGDIRMTAGGLNPSGRYSHAQIGHGGYGNGLLGDFSGNIVLEATTGHILVAGGQSYGNYAQVGHGGFGAGSGIAGNASGSIRLLAENDISLVAGTDQYTFARVGHGGRDLDGDFGLVGESIEVISLSGGLDVTGGAGTDSIAQIGHGDNNDASGLRKGDILVDVAKEISLVPGVIGAWIGHRTTNGTAGLANADVTIRARSFDAEVGDSGGDLFDISGAAGGMLGSNLAGGHVSLIDMGGGGIRVGAAIQGNSAFDLNLLSPSHIYLAGDVIQQGTGEVNVVAGWDPSVAPLTLSSPPSFRGYWVRDINMDTDIFGVAGSYATGNGSVWVGANHDLSASDTGVAVGSRAGQTNVVGHDVTIWGGALTGGLNTGAGKYSQIGYNHADAGTLASSTVTGRIRVAALNDLTLEANHFGVGTSATGSTWSGVDQTGFASFAKIGHGGERDTISGSLLSGAILITTGGDLFAQAGETLESYVQIGHGGHAPGSAGMQASGDIDVEIGGAIDMSGSDGVRSSVRIGHGGDLVGGSRTGAIDVSAAGGVTLLGGAGTDAGVYIGHGGAGANGSSGGAILVSSLSQLLLQGGGESGSSSQIGHGGRQGSGSVAGTIGIDAVGIGLFGGGGFATFAQIGHGGYGFAGSVDGQSIFVESSGDLIMTGGAGNNANAQIGHGGFGASGLLFSGDIAVDVTNDIGITGGTGQFAYSQIGNLGASVNSRMGGDLTVLSGGDIGLTSIDGSASAYAKIGHGQDFLPSVASVNPVAEITGDIRVGAFANLTLTDAMIGHLNAASVATLSAGETQIAVGMGDPTDPAAGTLVADSSSEFSGVDGLRFYLAQRGNNQIAAGALLNAVVFPGARVDPSNTQRYDEYVVHVVGDEVLFPNEHGNAFGTGPAPTSAGGYAFYYDTISLIAGSGDLPIENPVGGSGGNNGGPDPGTDPVVTPGPPFDYSAYFTLDEALEDWLRAREKQYSGFGSFDIFYENFDQYGPGGESTFDANDGSAYESPASERSE